MAIIQQSGRPALPVQGDTFSDPAEEWSDLEAYRAQLDAAIASVGRMELEGHPYFSWVGTAFLAGPGRVMTARNLAQTYAEGLGDTNLRLKPGLTISFTRKPEFGARVELRLKIASVRFIHPLYEVALCEVDANEMAAKAKASKGRTDPVVRGLTLAAQPPEGLSGRKVAVISFAAADARNDLNVVNNIYGSVSAFLYVQPGQLIEVRENQGAGILAHDCSTLGGSSGAPVVDLETGHVLGLHFGGRYLDRNFAVPSWELARDSRVRRQGVNFSDDPPWMYQWAEAELLSQSQAAPAITPQPKEDVAPAALETEVEYFAQNELYTMRDLLIKAGFGHPDKQQGLFIAMNTTYTASLPSQGLPDIRLLTVLDSMNRTERLTDGELPFETFLFNAVQNSRPLPESAKLEAYLEKLRD
jgi:hypothetical protein